MASTDPEYEPRRAEPGQTFGYTERGGKQRELTADEEGVVWPKTGADVVALDSFDLPVARKALGEAKDGLATADDKKDSTKTAPSAGGKE